MKKVLVLLVVIFVFSMAYSQDIKVNDKQDTLEGLRYFIDYDSNVAKGRMLGYNWLGCPDSYPLSSKEIISNYDTILSSKNDFIKAYEYQLLKEYKNDILSFFEDFKMLGNIYDKFTTSKSLHLPIRFINYKNSSICLVATTLIIDVKFNTLTSTSNERAKKIITQNLLSTIENFENSFSKTPFKYYGISCVYGSENFTKKYSFKPEYILLIFSKELIKKYTSYELSDTELLKQCDVFISDRDMGDYVKKISLFE